jgi:DNA recombination protein RmuC
MEQLPIILIVIVSGFAALFFFVHTKFKNLESKKTDENLVEWLKSMQTSLEQTNQTVNQTLTSSNQNITNVLHNNTKALNERLDNAAKVISDVQKNIGEMSEIGRNMKELQDFLKSPKLRGNIGEQVLKELLSQMLPKQSFHLQYAFKNGSIVDAAIQTSAGIIPIDSKFPMENFKKLNAAENDAEKKKADKDFKSDVKHHVDSISKKYIVTGEGTIDYALMYVPSESVYYEIVNNSDLFDYSLKVRVLPVSPMTFYAYLQAILMGFEGQKVSDRAREILSAIKSIQKEYEKVADSIDTLGRHVSNSYNMMSQVQSGFDKLGNKITTTTVIGKEEVQEIEKIVEKTEQLTLSGKN